MTTAEQLKKAREAAGMSLMDAAARLGILAIDLLNIEKAIVPASRWRGLPKRMERLYNPPTQPER